MWFLKWFRRRPSARRLCAWCGRNPRKSGRAFCSDICHAAWRRADAVRRGYTPSDDWTGPPAA